MGIAAEELSRHVIQPTLLYLDRYSPCAVSFLLAVAASQSSLGAALDTPHGHGLYSIPGFRHRQLWDNYLARDPELASLVRGLASQHAFLTGPHAELTVNLRYATAIAWLMVEAQGSCMPSDEDPREMAKIWREIFQPQGRLGDFMSAWQRCITPVNHLA